MPHKVDYRTWLRDSLRDCGWLKEYPMCVRQLPDGKLEIKDGHHRFEIAREFKLPVMYVITDDESTAYIIDRSQRPYSASDYLTSRLREAKNPAYTTVQNYCKETGISLSLAISMLGGHTAGTGNLLERFKDGTYKLGDRKNADIVADIITHCRKVGIPFALVTTFVMAVSRIAWAEGFNKDLLKHKISSFKDTMKKRMTMQDYIDMLDEVYNRQSRKKVPLAFLADEAARKRAAVQLPEKPKVKKVKTFRSSPAPFRPPDPPGGTIAP